MKILAFNIRLNEMIAAFSNFQFLNFSHFQIV